MGTVLIWGMFLGALLLPAQGFSAEAKNVRLIGHSNLQGRNSLQVFLKGNYAYIGHHRGEEFNPLSGKGESNGTMIVDVTHPRQPKWVANWGLPGQRPGDASSSGVNLHHPVVSGNRAYLSYLFGGDMVILDIADKTHLKMIAHLDFSPPYSGIHTTAPFNGIKVPNFTKGLGDVRNFLVLSEESFAYNCQELRRQLYIVDATEETNPIPVATFKVPDGDFCERGGRFGPHQFAETKDGEIIGGSLLYIAYFNAGLRVVEIPDPYHPREVGFYIPDPTSTGKSRGPRVIQTNDADLDYRGLIYITDRNGNGLHILQFTK